MLTPTTHPALEAQHQDIPAIANPPRPTEAIHEYPITVPYMQVVSMPIRVIVSMMSHTPDRLTQQPVVVGGAKLPDLRTEIYHTTLKIEDQVITNTSKILDIPVLAERRTNIRLPGASTRLCTGYLNRSNRERLFHETLSMKTTAAERLLCLRDTVPVYPLHILRPARIRAEVALWQEFPVPISVDIELQESRIAKPARLGCYRTVVPVIAHRAGPNVLNAKRIP